MKQRRMGRTGLKVSELCLGTMTFAAQADEREAFAIMDKAFEGGINFFDTADVYPVPVDPAKTGQTEAYIGRWLNQSGKRDDIILATKCRAKVGPHEWDGGLSRKHILKACDDSLRRLQTDYIDLYQTHSPDAETPIDETLAALDTLVHSGKVRYVGCSNYGAWALAKALWTSDKRDLARYDCVQPRYNLLFRQIEDELLPLCREEGVGVIAYNPLAGGFLTGKYQRDASAESGSRFNYFQGKTSLYHERYWQNAQFEAVEGLKAFFGPRNKPLTQVAVAWVLHRPEITAAIVGASRATQLDDTLASVNLTLDEEELAACDDAWFSIPRPRDPGIALR